MEIATKVLELFRNPITTIGDLVEFEDRLHNIDLKAEQRNYSRESLITTLYLAALPDLIRTEIVRAIKEDHPDKHLFSWPDLGNHSHSIIQNIAKHHVMTDPIDHLVFSNFAHTTYAANAYGMFAGKQTGSG